MKKSILLVLLSLSVLFSKIYDAKLLTDKTNLGSNEAVIVILDVDIEEQFSAFPRFPESEEYSAQLVNKQQYRSSSVSIINGKRTSKNVIKSKLYYQINFAKTGSVTLPALEFTIGEKNYKTNHITFSIGTEKVDPGIAVKFIQSDVNLYKGQQSKLTVRIMVKQESGNRISNSGLKGLLDALKEEFATNFRMEMLNPDGVEPESRVINGVYYSLYDIEFEVTAVKTGEHRFGPFNFNYHVETKSNDPFDMGFGSSFFTSSQTVDKVLRTPALAYTVKNRPPAPKGFKGAMSRVIIEGKPSKLTTKAGESITLKFSIRGKVPEEVIKTVDFPKIENCEVFDPETKLEKSTRSSGIYTERTFSYMLIPEKEGILTIPAISYIWFDVKKGDYITESIGPFTIEVLKGENGAEGTKRYLSQNKISTVGEDIQFIQQQLPTKKEVTKEYKNRFYHILLSIPWLISLLLVLWKLQQRFMPKNMAKEKKKRAYVKALKGLELIEKGSSNNSPISLFETYLDERVNIQAGSIKRDELAKLLEKRSVSKETIQKIITTLETIEMARYAGSESGTENVHSMKECIKLLEKEL